MDSTEKDRNGAADPRPGGCAVETIQRDPAGQLVVHLRGRAEPIRNARAARCFPWSAGETFISILDKDGKEVALLSALSELDDGSRRILQEELRDKVFNPRIKRILDFRVEFHVASVTAETDRGRASFQVDGRDNVRFLSDRRLLLRDVDGNVYEVPDLDALDAASRKYFQRFF